ncbi:ABC transporter permease [Bradyrhizobium sp. SSUT18]|uniref:ABC transporter permease n=1 Tax=Bradyrhizobium sp. SSUT18 TaxID=3040602 RepID=UPI003263B988
MKIISLFESLPMVQLIARRVLQGGLTLLLVSLLVFVGTELLPGDVAQAVLGQSATPESVSELRAQMGLDRPAPLRYLSWLFGILHLDFGMSLANQTPVSVLIGDRLGHTLVLAALSAAVAVPLSFAIGLTAATRPASKFDRVSSIAVLCVAALPEFFLATVLVLIFAVNLRWLPAIAYVTEYRSINQFVTSLAMPVATLAAVIISQMVRMIRATVVNVLSLPYIEMAVLKGVPYRRVILVHALRNAIGPIANVVALNLAYLVSGVVVVETIFAYPGLARLLVDAVSSRDYPVIQACVLIFCVAYIGLMLVADIAAILGNPRLRHAAVKK